MPDEVVPLREPRIPFYPQEAWLWLWGTKRDHKLEASLCQCLVVLLAVVRNARQGAVVPGLRPTLGPGMYVVDVAVVPLQVFQRIGVLAFLLLPQRALAELAVLQRDTVKLREDDDGGHFDRGLACVDHTVARNTGERQPLLVFYRADDLVVFINIQRRCDLV